MQKYNLAAIFKNSIVIKPEYFERFLVTNDQLYNLSYTLQQR